MHEELLKSLETLVAACEKAFTNPDTDMPEDAEDDVSIPGLGITYGMIWLARDALNQIADGRGEGVDNGSRCCKGGKPTARCAICAGYTPGYRNPEPPTAADDETPEPTEVQIEYARGFGDGVSHGEQLRTTTDAGREMAQTVASIAQLLRDHPTGYRRQRMRADADTLDKAAAMLRITPAGGEDGRDGSSFDVEAVSWAYRKLLDFGCYNSESGASWGDRLNLMLMQAPSDG